ncbi:MAG: hypothetical protein RIS45_891 [Planctomycetota bacterium]|jgi:hypothetical protein
MAARLPDGAILTLSTSFDTPKAVSAISNANPGAATAAAHGFTNGDLVLMSSGWSNLTNKVARVAASAAGTFNLEGFNTTSTSRYPAGSGAGTATEILTWAQVAQVLGFTTSGGDQQFANFSFLEDDFEQQLPTITSAQSLSIQIADDPSLAGYIALKAASEARTVQVLRLTLPDGSFILYVGTVSLNETPTVTKGSVMAVTATMALKNRPVRYAA